MNIVSYGGGTNSTAMLIECVNRGIKVDLILFADTGGERPHTYKYIEMFSRWLVGKGYPAIITVLRDLHTCTIPHLIQPVTMLRLLFLLADFFQ